MYVTAGKGFTPAVIETLNKHLGRATISNVLVFDINSFIDYLN
jgi:hypothetical protein